MGEGRSRKKGSGKCHGFWLTISKTGRVAQSRDTRPMPSEVVFVVVAFFRWEVVTKVSGNIGVREVRVFME